MPNVTIFIMKFTFTKKLFYLQSSPDRSVLFSSPSSDLKSVQASSSISLSSFSLCIAQQGLQLRELDPGMHILGVELEEFLVQSSAPRELPQLDLRVNVAAE